MSEVCRITVPCDPSSLSSNGIKKRKFREVLILKRNAWMVARNHWQKAGRPIAKGRVIVHITVRRGREIDIDNALSGLKSTIDGLFVGAITPDDGPKFVKYGLIEIETGAQWKANPEVEFIVEDL